MEVIINWRATAAGKERTNTEQNNDKEKIG